MKSKKPTCGLCGKTKNLTKTPCCNNWICDDADKYVIFSYETNSCYRNHDRYTLCAYHYHQQHSDEWQECKKCKEEIPLENYIEFATNEFNFEKLTNPPKVTIKCAKCGFKSNSVGDFPYQTSKGFYCYKTKCQKAALSF